jgi:hypothetical protein
VQHKFASIASLAAEKRQNVFDFRKNSARTRKAGNAANSSPTIFSLIVISIFSHRGSRMIHGQLISIHRDVNFVRQFVDLSGISARISIEFMSNHPSTICVARSRCCFSGGSAECVVVDVNLLNSIACANN